MAFRRIRVRAALSRIRFELAAGFLIAAPSALLLPGMICAQQDAGWIGDAHHTAWNAGEDLPTSGVLGAAQTPDGYLWLGSAVGLVRFDGVRFVVLDGQAVPALGSTMPGLTRPLLADRAGDLWIARPDRALVRYRTGHFEVAVDAAAAASLPEPPSAMAEDAAGRLLVLAGTRLFELHDGTITPARLPSGMPATGFTGVVVSPSGFWVGTPIDGLWHVDKDGARHVPHPHSPADAYVRPLLVDREGRLWIDGDGLRFLDGDTWVQPTIEGRPFGVFWTVQSPDGAIWLGSNGLGALRWRSGVLERFTTDGGLTHMAPSGMLVDAEGSVWLTSDAGLDRFRSAAFTTIDRRHGIPFDSPLLAFPDEAGGAWVRDFSGAIYHVYGGAADRTQRALLVRAVELPGDVPFASARGGGVWLFGLHSNRILRVRDDAVAEVHPSPELVWRGPRHGFEDATGTLWLAAAAGGLGRIRNLSYEAVSLPGFDTAPPVASLAPDGHGGVWVSIRRSPMLFHLQGDTVVGSYGPTAGIAEPVRNLALQAGDTLWGSTESGALVRIIGGRAATILEPGISAALASSAAVLIPDRTHLWIGSAAGIGRVPLLALHAAADGTAGAPSPRWFGPADGLRVGRTNRFDVGEGFRAPDGRIWFTTPAGLAVVDPGEIPVNRVAPTPVVEGVHVAGRAAPVPDGASVEANPERLEVQFTGGSLRMPERVEVEYRLDGADPDWIPAGPARTASYAHLRPGHYRFRVRARNEDGVPGAAEASLGFRVLPAWYQSWWFLGIVALGLAAAGAGTVGAWAHAASQAETRRLRDRYEAALAERARVAQELHDTLLQGFLGVTLHLQAVQDLIEKAPRDAADAMDRVLAMADHALREGRQLVWDMRPPELEGQDLSRALETATRRAVGDLSIAASFAVEGNPRTLSPEVETTVLRICREAVANAVRHGRPRTISMLLAYEKTGVRLRVRDDGVGFDPATVASANGDGHWGLRGMHDRARRAGGDVRIVSAVNTGTTVELRLPDAPGAR